MIYMPILEPFLRVVFYKPHTAAVNLLMCVFFMCRCLLRLRFYSLKIGRHLACLEKSNTSFGCATFPSMMVLRTFYNIFFYIEIGLERQYTPSPAAFITVSEVFEGVCVSYHLWSGLSGDDLPAQTQWVRARFHHFSLWHILTHLSFFTLGFVSKLQALYYSLISSINNLQLGI